jgi:hypothetical protein
MKKRAFLFLLLLFCALCERAYSQCVDQYTYTDILFIIDNSGSISDQEYNDFESIILATIQKVSQKCPDANGAIVHYGGPFGDSTAIEYDFSNLGSITNVSRQFCVTRDAMNMCEGGGGDDLNSAIGSIIGYFQNSTLTLNNENNLTVVIFTDAYGDEVGPCSYTNCSAIRPYTNIDLLKANYGASVAVVGVEPEADAGELAVYASPGGRYYDFEVLMHCDTCTMPRNYIPIRFDDFVNVASDSISKYIPCQTIVNPGFSVQIEGDEVYCRNIGELSELNALTAGGIPPFIFEWDNLLGFGPSKNVNPSIATTYTVTVTDANLCESEASFLVTPITCSTCFANAGNPRSINEKCEAASGNTQLFTDENIGTVVPNGYEEVFILTDINLISIYPY